MAKRTTVKYKFFSREINRRTIIAVSPVNTTRGKGGS